MILHSFFRIGRPMQGGLPIITCMSVISSKWWRLMYYFFFDFWFYDSLIALENNIKGVEYVHIWKSKVMVHIMCKYSSETQTCCKSSLSREAQTMSTDVVDIKLSFQVDSQLYPFLIPKYLIAVFPSTNTGSCAKTRFDEWVPIL